MRRLGVVLLAHAIAAQLAFDVWAWRRMPAPVKTDDFGGLLISEDWTTHIVGKHLLRSERHSGRIEVWNPKASAWVAFGQ